VLYVRVNENERKEREREKREKEGERKRRKHMGNRSSSLLQALFSIIRYVTPRVNTNMTIRKPKRDDKSIIH
jgi:hypothetical protein